MSRKRRYSDEFRLKIVKEYMSRRSGGTKMLGKKYCIHPSTILRWVHLYENHGRNGLTGGTGSYSGEFKVHVVEYMHNNRMSLTATADHFCIQSVPTLSKWERIYYEEGKEALFEERRGRNSMGKKKPVKPKNDVNQNEDLLAEVQRLRMENEYLKKLNALVQERERSEQKKK